MRSTTAPRRTAKRAVAPCLVALSVLFPRVAEAVPSFAEQTGQPFAAYHVGAFGPQLKQFGRDFKLNGYAATDGKPHPLPLAVTTKLSFTHTNNDQSTPAAPRFATNSNFSLDQASFYYAGRIAKGTGAFVQVTYDVLNATGIVPVAGTDKTTGAIPYWRLAVQQKLRPPLPGVRNLWPERQCVARRRRNRLRG